MNYLWDADLVTEGKGGGEGVILAFKAGEQEEKKAQEILREKERV